MKVKSRILAVGSALAMASFATAADAAVLIEGYGQWLYAAGTELAQSNTRFAFSFEVPNPLDSNPTSAISNFKYSLAGEAISLPSPTSVLFYPSDNGGLFDLSFGASIPTIIFEGAGVGTSDIGSTGVFTPGDFSSFTVRFGNDGPTLLSESEVVDPSGFGLGFLTVSSVAAVPEPATWVMMGLGFGLVGAGLRRQRVRKTTVAFA